VLAVILYAMILARYMGACAGASDSSGYLNNARMLAAGRVTIPMRLVPGLDPATRPVYLLPLGSNFTGCFRADRRNLCRGRSVGLCRALSL
jgi:hypothetical protein